MITRPSSLLVGVACAAGLLATACGGSAPANSAAASPSAGAAVLAADSAKRVVSAMDAAMEAVNSVRIKGTMTTGSETITVDLGIYGASDMSGTVDVNGVPVRLLSVGGGTYVKIDAEYLQADNLPAADCSSLCGKYVRLTAAQAKKVTGPLSMSAFTHGAFATLQSAIDDGTAKPFTPTTFDGQPVLQYQGGGYTIDVDRGGKPYPVWITDSQGIAVVFSDWGSVRKPAPPPASKVISFSDL